MEIHTAKTGLLRCCLYSTRLEKASVRPAAIGPHFRGNRKNSLRPLDAAHGTLGTPYLTNEAHTSSGGAPARDGCSAVTPEALGARLPTRQCAQHAHRCGPGRLPAECTRVIVVVTRRIIASLFGSRPALSSSVEALTKNLTASSP